jgi:hypothetical protein
MALAEAESWIAQGNNLLAFGPPGVGKTHMIAAIGHALIDRGYKALFVRTSELVQRLQAARRDLRLPAELAKLDRFDLLILYDLSYARRDQAEISALFELIAERYERKSIAITAKRAVLGMGPGVPGRGHDGGHRGSPGASLHDPGDERGQLPTPQLQFNDQRPTAPLKIVDAGHEAPGQGAARKVYLILDKLRVHHSKPVKAWLAEHKHEIEVFYLPSYSPELNRKLDGQGRSQAGRDKAGAGAHEAAAGKGYRQASPQDSRSASRNTSSMSLFAMQLDPSSFLPAQYQTEAAG